MAPLQDRGCDSLSRSAERDAASVFYFVSFGEEMLVFGTAKSVFGACYSQNFSLVNVSVTSG